MTFTEEQKQIFKFVETGQSHGIIDAVAGAGKTTTIMECAKYVSDRKSVLFCAFNKSIAKEIESKFRQNGMHDVTVKKIHSLGWQILHVNNSTGKPLTLNDTKYHELLRSDDVKRQLAPLYNKILVLNNLDPETIWDDQKKFAINNLTYLVNERLININQKARSTLTPENIDEFENLVIHFGIFNEIEAKKENFKKELSFYFDCHKILLANGNDFSLRTMIIDFADMLYLPYKWQLYPTQQFQFLFIDECQDLSRSQLYVAIKYGKKDARIMAVGDPRQSIYGFTGADIESFDRIKLVTKATALPLTTCFRCPQNVIKMAREIRPDITGAKQNEGMITTIKFNDVVALARPNDLIISRLRAPLLLMVFNFIDKDIKVHIHEDEVREIINEIKNIFKPAELNTKILSQPPGFEILREDVLKRWKFIIKKNAERIIDNTERNLFIQNEIRYLEQKLDFLEKKHERWKNECSTIMTILEKIKEYISAQNDAVKLSTIHRAKGLENDRVFIVNYDELPFTRLEQKNWEKTQELNLKYVALTRTKSELFLVQADKQATIESEGSLFDNLPFV